MSFYYFQEEMEIFLKNTIAKSIDTKRYDLMQDLAITWIHYPNNSPNERGSGCGLNKNINIYPASIVKLVYGLAIHKWIEQQLLTFDDFIDNAVYKMLQHSSNDATSFVVDILTGSTSGPSITGESWENWQQQRKLINDWLNSINWNELKGFNCCQKTWEDEPFGREKDFYCINGENRNSMSTEGTGRIFESIMRHLTYTKDNVNLKYYLSRNLKKEFYSLDKNNQIEGFLGEGLPEETPFWSKAGLMSEVRHDAAYWINDDSSETLLIVFGNNKEFVKDQSIFPLISKTIYEYQEGN